MKTSMGKDRFANLFGKEFDTCTVGIPHYNYFHDRLVHILLDKYNTSEPISILEIGAGTGNLLCSLKNSRLQFNYVGVESSPIMFEQIQRKFRDLDNVSFILGDALSFLNAKQKFSVVINSWTFHNWNYQYRKEVIDGVFHNLDSNGVFLSADKIAVRCPNIHKQHYIWQINYVRKIFSSRPDIVREWIHHYKIDEEVDILMKEDVFSSTLKEIGFSVCKTVERKYMDLIYVACK